MGAGDRPTSFDGGGHACCVFDTDDDQHALVGRFLAEGIDGGERLLYLSEGTTPATIVRLLDDRGVDGAGCLRSGRLQVRATDESYLAGGGFEAARMAQALRAAVRQALDDGYAGLRVTGEMAWARRAGPGGTVDLTDYERSVGPLFEDGSLSALCQYDRRAFDDESTAAVARHHDACATASGGGGFVARRRGQAVQLGGDLDFGDVGVLAACLEGREEVDLGEVDFADVAAVRVLVAAAGRLPEGCTLRLRNVPPAVRRVLAVTGWDATPRLAVG